MAVRVGMTEQIEAWIKVRDQPSGLQPALIHLFRGLVVFLTAKSANNLMEGIIIHRREPTSPPVVP